MHLARVVCVFLFCCSLAAQERASLPQVSSSAEGSFFLSGIVYRYASAGDYTVVAAVHPALNRKYLAVKLRITNIGQEPVTVRPEDVSVEDEMAGRKLDFVSAGELGKRMRRPYNWVRLAVNPDSATDAEASHGPVTPQMLQTMRAMAMARAASGSGGVMLPQRNILFTDTPGAIQMDGGQVPLECGQVCQLLRRENAVPDVLVQLQRQNSADYVEHAALLANTIAPNAEAAGVLFYPMARLARGPHGKKSGTVRLTVPVGQEKFDLEFTVE